MRKRVGLATAIFGIIGCSSSGSAPDVIMTPPAPPPPVLFSPSVSSYLASSHRLIDTEVAGITRSDSIALRYRFTTVITADESGLLVSVGIDSILDATAPKIGPAHVDEAKGATYTARLSRTGRIDGFLTTHGSSPLLDIVSSQTAVLFPILPAEGILPEQTWADTTNAERVDGGVSLIFRIVTNYRSKEWGEAVGTTVLPIEWDRAYEVDGTGSQFGRRFTLHGTGSVSGRSWFTRDGIFAGSVSEDDLVAQIEVDDVGVVTPIRQHQLDTVRVLRKHD